MPPAASVLDLPVHVLPDYAGCLIEQIVSARGGHVVTLNAEMAMLARQEPKLAGLIRRAELVVPDGAGVVWAMRFQGRRVQRCAGIDLVSAVLPELARQRTRVFLLGAAPGVAEAVAGQWSKQYPGLVLCGQHDGYFTEVDEAGLREQLQAANPQVILVGLGVPKQEFWIERTRPYLPTAVFVGVGGSFDIWAGTKERAPKWLRENHLEWFYRLLKEPWRWRRMLALPKFALAILRGVLP